MGANDGAMVRVPQRLLDEVVLPAQRLIYERTNEVLTTGQVVRRLIAVGFAAETLQAECNVLSSAAQ